MSTGEAGDGRFCPVSSYPSHRLHFYGLRCHVIPGRPLMPCPSVTGWYPFEVWRELIVDVRALELVSCGITERLRSLRLPGLFRPGSALRDTG